MPEPGPPAARSRSNWRGPQGEERQHGPNSWTLEAGLSGPGWAGMGQSESERAIIGSASKNPCLQARRLGAEAALHRRAESSAMAAAQGPQPAAHPPPQALRAAWPPPPQALQPVQPVQQAAAAAQPSVIATTPAFRPSPMPMPHTGCLGGVAVVVGVLREQVHEAMDNAASEQHPRQSAQPAALQGMEEVLPASLRAE